MTVCFGFFLSTCPFSNSFRIHEPCSNRSCNASIISKPFFVLLHGAWHTPKCFAPLIAARNNGGRADRVVAPALPSSNATPVPADWDADTATIRATVSQLAEEGQDVVVVMHSLSGLTGGTSLDGLDKQCRGGKGLKGGVVRLVYIAAFLGPEGFQHSATGTRENMVRQMKTDMDVRGVESW